MSKETDNSVIVKYGKGNAGMFIDREPKICAAGVPTAQPKNSVCETFQQYLLKDQVDALLSDTIHPASKPEPLPPLRHPLPLDLRNAGLYTEVATLINPKNKTKFQNIVDDIKETVYSSYWNKQIGESPDLTPKFPDGYVIEGTTFGKKVDRPESLYDIVLPKVPLEDKTPHAQWPGVQTDRKYCRPPFDPNLFYGHRLKMDKRGQQVKCCLTQDEVKLGNSEKKHISIIEANFVESTRPSLGKPLTPNDNAKSLPPGFAYGKRIINRPSVKECLQYCGINEKQDLFEKCLGHLNSLKSSLSHCFHPSFFNDLYLNLKYLDKEKCNWLPKEIVYNFCGEKLIRFNEPLIESLLSIYNAFDGQRIEYKTFVKIINYREPLPGPPCPQMSPQAEHCADYVTTYTEMVKPGQEIDGRLRAGVPSGRFFDRSYPITPEGYCKADRAYFCEESDMKSCLFPCTLTTMNVNHRDMFCKREIVELRKIFESAGETFTDERFDILWKEAQKLHPHGWVCIESFRRALQNQENV